jgi:hypothetical protein
MRPVSTRLRDEEAVTLALPMLLDNRRKLSGNMMDAVQLILRP